MLCLGSFQRRNSILSNWLEQNHTIPQTRGPQITPELHEKHYFLPDSMFIWKGRVSVFIQGQALVSVISRPCCGGNAYYVVVLGPCLLWPWGLFPWRNGLREMRGVTTGTALGKQKKSDPTTVKLCIFSHIFRSSLYKLFPNVTGFWHILYHTVSICLGRSWSSFLFIPYCPSQFCSFCRYMTRFAFALLMHVTTKHLQREGSICKLFHQYFSHMYCVHIVNSAKYIHTVNKQEPTHFFLASKQAFRFWNRALLCNQKIDQKYYINLRARGAPHTAAVWSVRREAESFRCAAYYSQDSPQQLVMEQQPCCLCKHVKFSLITDNLTNIFKGNVMLENSAGSIGKEKNIILCKTNKCSNIASEQETNDNTVKHWCCHIAHFHMTKWFLFCKEYCVPLPEMSQHWMGSRIKVLLS